MWPDVHVFTWSLFKFGQNKQVRASALVLLRGEEEMILAPLFLFWKTKSPVASFDPEQRQRANVSSVLRFKNYLYCLEKAQI